MLHKNIPYRRHQVERKRKKVVEQIRIWATGDYLLDKFITPYWVEHSIPLWQDKRFIGKALQTPHPCSCRSCGNVDRSLYGESRAEVKNTQELLDILEEMGYNSTVVKKINKGYYDW